MPQPPRAGTVYTVRWGEGRNTRARWYRRPSDARRMRAYLTEQLGVDAAIYATEVAAWQEIP